MRLSRILAFTGAAIVALLAIASPTRAAEPVKEIRIDYATYNPVGLLLKDKGWLEEAFKADGISVRWILSAGSNKALEFLNAGSLDFGSTAGAAALLGRVNGNPVKSIYVYSRPEWTALVERADGTLKSPADLKGKKIAVTRGTDPHIFLIQALASAKLKESDAKLVLLQHQDGQLALLRGDVDAWAGLDPLMAAAEVEQGAKLFYRKPELNSWGVLNTRDEFAAQQPQLVARVLGVYEKARLYALDHPAELKASLIQATKLPDKVIDKQIERTDIRYGRIGAEQRKTILAAGLALQGAGVIKPDVDVRAVTDALIDERFNLATN